MCCRSTNGCCLEQPLSMQCVVCYELCVCRSLVGQWEFKMCEFTVVRDITAVID
jgi:hypothetical protein